MVSNIVIFIVIISLLYAYELYCKEFTAVTSAIQQISSGTCRLGCRQQEFHIIEDQDNVVEPENTDQNLEVNRETADVTTVCICDACPCALVETVLKKCELIVNIYASSIEVLSTCYYNFVKMLCDLYIYAEQAMRSGDSCQGTIQQSNKSKKIFIIRRKTQEDIQGVDKNSNKLTKLIIKKSSVTDLEEAGTSKAHDESLKTIESTTYCSRCKEKGVICINKCPRAEKDK